MRRFIAVCVATGCVLALAGCAQPAKQSGAPGGTPAAAPSAQQVWTSALSNKSYQAWQAAPGYETKQPAKGPHGKSVQVFVDPNISKTLTGPSATAWPVGSMIVKDAFDASNAPIAVEYMQKTESGWYYASYDMTGKVLKDGVEVAPCQPCHVTGSDAVKSFKLP